MLEEILFGIGTVVIIFLISLLYQLVKDWLLGGRKGENDHIKG